MMKLQEAIKRLNRIKAPECVRKGWTGRFVIELSVDVRRGEPPIPMCSYRVWDSEKKIHFTGPTLEACVLEVENHYSPDTKPASETEETLFQEAHELTQPS